MSRQYYEVYLSFGSNVGDRRANIESAWKQLDVSGVETKILSSLYETAPWGNTKQAAFLNCAGGFETKFTPGELMNEILKIEKSMGRLRTGKWQSRIIDIDILFFGNQIINESGLIIPHPETEKRKFVLIPMAEIAAELYHPVLKKTIRQLLIECRDDLMVVALNQ